MSLLNQSPWKREAGALRPERPEIWDSGVLLVDKPSGISSMDVIRLLKRVAKFKKIGHGGTLDPFATGVLPILVNGATSLSNSIMAGTKEYEGRFILGVTYDTQDITGEQVGETRSVALDLDLPGIQVRANEFIGEIEQVPPIYSAVKKSGRKLYEYARAGQEIDREARKVSVDAFEILSWDGVSRVDFRVKVQKGVYVRTLIHDLGEKLGTGATLESLRRTRVGSLQIEEGVQVSTLKFVSDIREHLKPTSHFIRG